MVSNYVAVLEIIELNTSKINSEFMLQKWYFFNLKYNT